MSRSRDPKPLSDLLEDFIDSYPHRKRLKKGMILSLWPRVVGNKISEQSENLHFEGDKLVVHVNNSIWRHELHMRRYQITKKLNNRVNEDIISELVVKN